MRIRSWRAVLGLSRATRCRHARGADGGGGDSPWTTEPHEAVLAPPGPVVTHRTRRSFTFCSSITSGACPPPTRRTRSSARPTCTACCRADRTRSGTSTRRHTKRCGRSTRTWPRTTWRGSWASPRPRPPPVEISPPEVYARSSAPGPRVSSPGPRPRTFRRGLGTRLCRGWEGRFSTRRRRFARRCGWRRPSARAAARRRRGDARAPGARRRCSARA